MQRRGSVSPDRARDAEAHRAALAAPAAAVAAGERAAQPKAAASASTSQPEPLEQIEALAPLEPIEPLETLEPIGPIRPLEPIEPLEPIQPLASLAAAPAAARGNGRPEIAASLQDIASIKDLDTLLEWVLQEARRFANADAGTIYMLAGNYLYFSYVQNDTLFRQESAVDKYVYSLTRLPVNKKSLAGYAAATGEPLMIDDVYDIKSEVSYSFNASFDRKTNYRTRSIMVVPLRIRDQGVVGVLQLINAKDPDGGVVPFSMRDQETVTSFADRAAVAIEKARDAREMVLRMVDIAEMRDPFETTEHARRVGAYATEIYQVWAERRGLPCARPRSCTTSARSP